MPYDRAGSWSPEAGMPAHARADAALIHRLEDDLHDHMATVRPARYRHSLSVARTAEQMALAYGVDPLLARVAGILHDWDKVLSPREQVDLAVRLGIDLGVDMDLVRPLLHGMTAACHLPDRYPDLPAPIWQAIARHTVGHADMTPLDAVLFVADGVEPCRRDVPAVHEVRELVDARAPLEDVFWSSFRHGVSYVIATGRYLYPGTLDTYNELVLRRGTTQG